MDKDIHINNIDAAEKNICTKPIEIHVINNAHKIQREEQPVLKIRPLAAACIGLNNTSIPIERNLTFPHFWTDIDVHEQFLISKPSCYLIFGKPSVGMFALGEAMAEKFKCVHICPQKIIEDEQQLNTKTWKAIDFNLQQNRKLSFDYMFEIMKCKLESQIVAHRGYVLTGFPLISTSAKTTVYLRELHSEVSVSLAQDFCEDILFNTLKQNEERIKNSINEAGEDVSGNEFPEGDKIDKERMLTEIENIHSLDPCGQVIIKKKGQIKSKSSVILKQTSDIFQLSVNSEFIIYLTCPDEDLVCKAKHKFSNYMSSTNTVLPFEKKSTVNDIRWPAKYIMNDFFDKFITQIHTAKYDCRHPRYFRKKLLDQICNYKTHCLPFIENKIQDFNPNFIIKLDGRTSTDFCIHTIEEKLMLMSVKPVLIPSTLSEIVNTKENKSKIESISDIGEFWKNLPNIDIIKAENINFELRPSLWSNKCPVELKYGRSVIGQIKYAVTLFNNVYLLSSSKAYTDFCKNPRRYLKLQYLKPTCRIMVMGSKNSGKSMVSACLKWLFDGEIINYDTFYAGEKIKKKNMLHLSVLSEIMPIIEDKRLNEWILLETQRTNSLSQWIEDTCTNIKNMDNTGFLDISENDKTMFPFLNDFTEVQHILLNKHLLRQYAPHELRYPAAKPSVPVLGEPDVTNGILRFIEQNFLESDLEPSPGEIVLELSKILMDIESKTQTITNGNRMYGNWIVDGFPVTPKYWEELLNVKLIPDYIICLAENREVDVDLLAAYNKIESATKDHSYRFKVANDPLVYTKLTIKSILKTNNIFESILNDLMTAVMNQNKSDYSEQPIQLLTESLEKFREEWDSLKILLEGNQQLFIEIEIQEKTDVQIMEEVLLKIRTIHNNTFRENVEDHGEDFSKTSFLSETGIYCPIEYYRYRVLWHGKPEYSLKYNNRIYCFSNEETMMQFKSDPTIHLNTCNPTKPLPPLRVCIIGCLGSGRTTVSKSIAKELGLLHLDFSLIVNNFIIPSHCKKVGRKFENIFIDVPFDDEEVLDIKHVEESHEVESLSEDSLRKNVYDYFEKGSPLQTLILRNLLKKIWFEEPYASTGFILDGFPRLPIDIEEMIATHAIPDIILELNVNADDSLDRLLPKMLNKFKEQLKVAKCLSNEQYLAALESWMTNVAKHTVSKLIFDELVNNVFASSGESPNKTSKKETIADAVMPAVLDTDEELFNTHRTVVEVFPEPVNEDKWESVEDAENRIGERIEVLFQMETENIENLKDLLTQQRIKLISIEGSVNIKKVLKDCLLHMSFLRTRNESFFEQCFRVTMDVAETLLSNGHFFLSKFIRQCPVRIYENPSTLFNLFKAHKTQGDIIPIIHRSYIYFLENELSSTKFHENPLKYITSNNIESFITYPLRVGIIGSPKSGKSSLAARIEKEFKVIPISRGMAVRHVLDNMCWTELANDIKTQLISGKTVSADLIMQSVQIVIVDHRSMMQGYVLDGFPSSIPEALHLMNVGLYPFIMFDLRGGLNVTVKHSLKDAFYEDIKRLPAYSKKFNEYRYSKWQEKYNEIRTWINDDYQNVYSIPPTNSKWECWNKAKKTIQKIVPNVHNYLTNVSSKAVSLDYICISNIDFNRQSSKFKNYCPACLEGNVLKQSNLPVQRHGLIQYKQCFYWSCAMHTKTILASPNRYLIQNSAVVPKYLPLRITYYNNDKLYENGTCIVTYAESLPAQNIILGNHKYAAGYMDKIYLFCTERCLYKFMETPQNFYNIKTLKKMNILPRIMFKDLPHLGYLEQTLGNILTEACCYVNIVRPIFPGLKADISGLLLIALILKTHNPHAKPEELISYSNTKALFEFSCKLGKKTGLLLRSRDNPFANKYPHCCLNLKSDDTARRVPVPDERFDYLCEFHKPASKVPAFLNVVDIAGLVKGAAEGQGLGNAFLSHIKACDAIFHLCRAFDDEDVIHVDGEVNPVRDLETIGEELRLKDEEQLLQNLDKLERTMGRSTDKKLKPEHDSLLRVKTVLVDEKRHIRFADWSAADIEVLNKYLFLTSKPALYLVNLSEKDYIRKKNKWLPKLKEWIDKNDPGAPLIPFSGALESKLFEMDPQEAKAYLKENNATSALDKIIVQGYKALQLEYFFTAGPDEVKAWIVQRGTKAPQAAGRIHTDFEKGFIMAEVMHFKDFKEEGTEAACKAAGKYRQQGRNYTVEDGDVIFFKFNAGAGLKDPKKK